MKVTVEVDCTPIEARTFFGLPDVQPMQAAMMDQLQDKMMANIDKFSPESLIQSWFTFDPKIAERFTEMFANMTGMGAVARPKGEIGHYAMRCAPFGLFLILTGLVASPPCHAEDLDVAIARQQWDEQIRQQQERVAQWLRDRRRPVNRSTTWEQTADERVQRALHDPYLVRGDVIVTRHGFYRYRGTPDDRARQAGDFVLIESQTATQGTR